MVFVIGSILASILAGRAVSQQHLDDRHVRSIGLSVFSLEVSTGIPEYLVLSGSYLLSRQFAVGVKIQKFILGRTDDGNDRLLRILAFGGPYISGISFGPTVSYYFSPLARTGDIFNNVSFESTVATPATRHDPKRRYLAATFHLALSHHDRGEQRASFSYGIGLIAVCCTGMSTWVSPSARLGLLVNF